jgi:hypothetical protein
MATPINPRDEVFLITSYALALSAPADQNHARALCPADDLEARYDPGGATMPDPVGALILDLLEWIGPRARPYREVMEAWRTSCPRLPVWEEANERGFIEYHHAPGSEAVVSVSALGAKFLAERRPTIPEPRRD